MHLVYPPTFCITIVSNFSWVLQSPQEKSKTNKVGEGRGRKQGGGGEGGKQGGYGLCENGE